MKENNKNEACTEISGIVAHCARSHSLPIFQQHHHQKKTMAQLAKDDNSSMNTMMVPTPTIIGLESNICVSKVWHRSFEDSHFLTHYTSTTTTRPTATKLGRSSGILILLQFLGSLVAPELQMFEIILG
jgi:hypothetical protein